MAQLAITRNGEISEGEGIVLVAKVEDSGPLLQAVSVGVDGKTTNASVLLREDAAYDSCRACKDDVGKWASLAFEFIIPTGIVAAPSAVGAMNRLATFLRYGSSADFGDASASIHSWRSCAKEVIDAATIESLWGNKFRELRENTKKQLSGYDWFQQLGRKGQMRLSGATTMTGVLALIGSYVLLTHNLGERVADLICRSDPGCESPFIRRCFGPSSSKAPYSTYKLEYDIRRPHREVILEVNRRREASGTFETEFVTLIAPTKAEQSECSSEPCWVTRPPNDEAAFVVRQDLSAPGMLVQDSSLGRDVPVVCVGADVGRQ